MRKRVIAQSLVAVVILLGLVSCVTPDKKITSDKAALQKKDFVHRSQKDSVNWKNIDVPCKPFQPKETDLEWPGEKLGLTGPIIATGGAGRDAYIAVFDPAGALVGCISKRDAKKHPECLFEIIRLAHRRGEVQLERALLRERKE